MRPENPSRLYVTVRDDVLCTKSNGDTILKGRRATSFHAVKDDVINAGATYVSDESCVVDGNLITAQTPADLTPLQSVLNQLKKKRKLFI